MSKHRDYTTYQHLGGGKGEGNATSPRAWCYMLKIISCIVNKKREDYYFNCQPFRDYFKCGRCGHGNILPRKKYKCRVCGAIVTEIRYAEEYPNLLKDRPLNVRFI